MNTENKLKIDDFTRALAECIHQAQCAVVDPMVHAEIWKKELLELAKGKMPVIEELEKASSEYANEEYNHKSPTTLPNRCRGCYAPLMYAFKAGAKWQMAQMIKDATDVTVHVDAGGYPYIPQMELYDYDKDMPLAKKGDKYKVVLIKE